ncbi:MAG: DUF2795 domain-containing protein, partial [Ktedonobacteraceae bacterium]|nr:DUF2795 domain-containing protein [Ktedonobacteraceae bacterium]
MSTNAKNTQDIEQYLTSVNYPSDKATIMSRAQQQGASPEVINALRQLPNASFASASEVRAALGKNIS